MEVAVNAVIHLIKHDFIEPALSQLYHAATRSFYFLFFLLQAAPVNIHRLAVRDIMMAVHKFTVNIVRKSVRYDANTSKSLISHINGRIEGKHESGYV
jgi:hypothetical protein